MKPSMTVRQAAEEYIHGQELLAEFQSLNNTKIGIKFGCRSETVMRVIKNRPNRLSEEDQRYIRLLVVERKKAELEYKRRTYEALGRLTGHPTDRIRIELYLMGYLKEEAMA